MHLIGTLYRKIWLSILKIKAICTINNMVKRRRVRNDLKNNKID